MALALDPEEELGVVSCIELSKVSNCDFSWSCGLSEVPVDLGCCASSSSNLSYHPCIKGIEFPSCIVPTAKFDFNNNYWPFLGMWNHYDVWLTYGIYTFIPLCSGIAYPHAVVNGVVLFKKFL